MDLEVASHCVRPLTKDYLSKLPHYVLPCMNLRRLFPFDENQDYTSESFLKEITWVSSLPTPITPLVSAGVESLNGIDSTTTLIRDKIRWQMKKEKFLNAVIKDKKNISEKILNRAKEAQSNINSEVPRGVALLAEHLDKDPDPQFSGVYNWYYSGGTLATLANNEENFLLYSNQSKLSCCKCNEEGNTELLFTLGLDMKTPVHQIVTSAVGAAVRQKSCVSLLALGESDDKLCLNKIHSVSNKSDPFLAVALRNKSNKKYCTLSSSGILKLWDVEYTKGYMVKLRVGPGKGVTVMDSWSSIQFVDNKTLLLADRCCIHLLDTRVDMREKQLAWCPRKLGEQCEQLSCITQSQLADHVVYSMTTHQALTLDLRIGFSQRWSHMMAAPPYIGFTYVIDNDQEFLCIGSQVMSDCLAIVNKWRKDDPQAEYRPMLLPSPSQGLMAARRQGLCLEPTLSQRYSQSMIGLTYLPSENGFYVVRQSATDDVFIQQLISSDNKQTFHQLTDKQIEAYSDWGKLAMSLQEPTSVTVSDVKNFTPLLEALTDSYPPLEPSRSGMCGKDIGGGWRRSKQYLEDCVDLLAPKLLSVWEVENEEEWQEQEEETLTEQDPAEKVHNWLHAGSITLNDQTITDIPSQKPRVTSTPYVMPALGFESPTKSLEEPSPCMTYPEQTVLHSPDVSLPSAIPHPPSPPSIPSSGSDKPGYKKRKLLHDDLTTPPKQLVSAAKKPPTSTAKKKFIPGF